MHCIVQITDCHLLDEADACLHGVNPDDALARALKLAADLAPNLIVASGDLTENGNANAYRRLKILLQNAPVPVICMPGNHDDPGLMFDLLPANNISMTEAVTLTGWHLLFLDSTVVDKPHGHLDEGQLDALSKQLAEHPDEHKLVFVHHQPVATHSPWIDCMGLNNGDELLAVLGRDERVRALAFGHIHHAFEADHEGIRIFGTPATSFQAKPAHPTMELDAERGPGLRWFKLYENGKFDSGVKRLPQPLAPRP